MDLRFDSRIGIAGLAVGLIGIAVTILWPDKKWLGWVFLTFGATSLLLWGVLEIKQRVESPHYSLVASIALGCFLGGTISAILWKSAHSQRHEIKEGDTGVQLSITCDNVPLPMTYRGDLWILDAVMFRGLGKFTAPPNQEAWWPEKDSNGLGYVCTVKNFGSKPAYGASFHIKLSVLGLIRDGDNSESGEVEKIHDITVAIPKPLEQQGGGQFSFYVCSYDPDRQLLMLLPSVALIDSSDSKNKQVVPLRVASTMGNPLSIPQKNPFPIIRPAPKKRRRNK